MITAKVIKTTLKDSDGLSITFDTLGVNYSKEAPEPTEPTEPIEPEPEPEPDPNTDPEPNTEPDPDNTEPDNTEGGE